MLWGFYYYLSLYSAIRNNTGVKSTSSTFLASRCIRLKEGKKCPLIFVYILVFICNKLDKKKTPSNRGLLLVLLNQVFPCFHFLSKTTPSHYLNYYRYFFSLGRKNGVFLNCHMWQLAKNNIATFNLKEIIYSLNVWVSCWKYRNF